MYFSNILETDTINNIKYRNNVVTGEIATVNGNNTYDVYISGSDVAYPNIPTTVKEPDFEVGEAVEILIEYGNKEMPIIIGHAKKVAQEFVEDEINVLVTTLDAYSITEDSAYLEARVEEIEGYENVIKRGFYYGTSTGYGNDIYSTGSFAAGSYNKQITGLDANTTYHYQAYVHDAYNDEHKGEDKTMMTNIFRGYVLIVAYPNTFQLFDKDGNLLKSIANDGWSYGGCGITMDSQGYIYVEESDVIKKYDSNLNLLVTQNIESGSNWIEGINCGNDGYLYTLEGIASGYDIKKRSRTDLTIVDTIPITSDSSDFHYGTPCFDSDGNIYVVGDDKDICKYSSAGVKLASIDVGTFYGLYNGCGVCGNYVYFVQSASPDTIYYLPLDLSTYHTWNLPSAIAYALTVADNHIILSGWDGDGDGATSKYDSNRNLIWTKKLDPITSYAYKAGGYNF